MAAKFELIGQKFGKFTVLPETKKLRGTFIMVRCDCGNEEIFQDTRMKCFEKTQCRRCMQLEKYDLYNKSGARKYESRNPIKIGDVFGKLTVTATVVNECTFVCNCSCGNTDVRSRDYLLGASKAKACGQCARKVAACNGRDFWLKKWKSRIGSTRNGSVILDAYLEDNVITMKLKCICGKEFVLPSKKVRQKEVYCDSCLLDSPSESKSRAIKELLRVGIYSHEQIAKMAGVDVEHVKTLA